MSYSKLRQLLTKTLCVWICIFTVTHATQSQLPLFLESTELEKLPTAKMCYVQAGVIFSKSRQGNDY